MAQTLIWSREALDDIDAIAEYISRDSVFYANKVVERLVGDIDDIVKKVRFPDWQRTTQGGRVDAERVAAHAAEVQAAH